MSPFAWAALAAACWGIAPLFEKIGLRGQADPVIGVFVRSIGVLSGALGLLMVVPRIVPQLGALSARNWLCLLAGGLVASTLGQLCFYRALKLGDVSRVVPVGASYPVIACVLGVLLLKEPMTAAKGLGIALVVAGTWLLR